MHAKWTKEQEKEEEIHKAATVVIFDSIGILHHSAKKSNCDACQVFTRIDCHKNKVMLRRIIFYFSAIKRVRAISSSFKKKKALVH